MIIIYICIFFIGASIASFLNATLYRIENGYKYPEIVELGSHCEKCKHMLTWYELIPIFGYIFIKGRCTSCKKKIDIYYPLSELFLGTIFLLFFLYSITWYIWIIIIFLFLLSYHDIKYKAVPQNMVHVFLLVCTLLFFLFAFNIANLYFPLIITLSLLVINLFKKSFGMGDILVLLGLGVFLNYEEYLVMFWLGIMIALLYSVIWIMKKKVDIKKAKVAMLPFFSISFSIAILYEEKIYDWLLKCMRIW